MAGSAGGSSRGLFLLALLRCWPGLLAAAAVSAAEAALGGPTPWTAACREAVEAGEGVLLLWRLPHEGDGSPAGQAAMQEADALRSASEPLRVVAGLRLAARLALADQGGRELGQGDFDVLVGLASAALPVGATQYG